VLALGGDGEWDEARLTPFCDQRWRHLQDVVHGGNADYSVFQVGYALSTDGTTWTKHPSNPVLQPGGAGEWDEGYALCRAC